MNRFDPASFESLEPRRLLAYVAGAQALDAFAQVLPAVAFDADRPSTTAVDRAWTRAADLSQYTPAELAARTWVARADDPAALRAAVGAGEVRPTGILDDAWLVTLPDGVDAPAALAGASDAFYPDVAHGHVTRAVPNDPRFGQQWHLRNTGQTGGTAGADVNVVPAWDIARGGGVVIGVVDDAVNYNHRDLRPNYDTTLDYDYVNNDPTPLPAGSWESHGTSVAGVAAARGFNGVDVTGSAPEATLTGLRLLGNGTDLNESRSLSHRDQDIDIYTNSWGPFDDGGRLETWGPLTAAAVEGSIAGGRGGLGSIYTWAAGNGLGSNDNANYDGYASSRYTIAVGAINDDGRQSYYSEPGASMLVTTYSNSPGIVTTDVSGGIDFNFGGTSSATPLAAGVVALMLDVNTGLTWRDVQHILVETSVDNHANDGDWQTNGAGHTINHKYGHGSIDAHAAVLAAQDWETVADEVSATTGRVNLTRSIPDNNAGGIVVPIDFEPGVRIETVELVADIDTTYRGDLQIELVSPDGTVSVLSEPHGDSGNDFNNWMFTSVRHWDELSDGQWQLRISDRGPADLATLRGFELTVHGTAADAVAPALASSTFDFQRRQAVEFVFDEDVSVTGFQVRNTTTGELLDAARFGVAVDGNQVTLTNDLATHGLLPSGRYEATADVVDAAGNAGTGSLRFAFLSGDGNLDGRVDGRDVQPIRLNLGNRDRGFTGGDYNYDGVTDGRDVQAIRLNLGSTLPPVPAPAPASLFSDGPLDQDGEGVRGGLARAVGL